VDNEYLIRLIHEYNPRLRGEALVSPPTKRDLYTEIERWLSKKQAIAIVGLRRTGKTTLMRQLESGMGGERVTLFFSFDEEETQKKDVLVFVLDYAINTIGAGCIFLDEIHYVDDWEGILKRYYDQKNVKLIVSGSESLEISKAKATLAGRLITFQLDPLTFSEYLRLKGKDIDTAGANLDNFTAMKRLYLSCITSREYYEHEFVEYLYKGAFPELVQEEDDERVRRYISDLVVKKIIYRDIPAIFEIRRRDILFELFRYSCDTSASLFDIQNLAKVFNAHYETITSYLFYLRSAFLLRVAETYTLIPAKRARKNKKLYVIHPAIACAVLGYGRTQLIGKILGPYVETLFAGEYFWRDSHKREVDVVHDDNGKLLPVEIKYQSQINAADTTNLLYFMNRYHLHTGVIITKNLMDKKTVDEKEILYIPAWLALLANHR
jgi:uncharacterized protein